MSDNTESVRAEITRLQVYADRYASMERHVEDLRYTVKRIEGLTYPQGHKREPEVVLKQIRELCAALLEGREPKDLLAAAAGEGGTR